MSKSLNGSGSLNLTLNELRLLEIKATNISSTNATFTGTVTINNFTISGTFLVDTVEATTLILTGLTDATLNQEYGLSVFDTITQKFYKIPRNTKRDLPRKPF